jgi:6-phosphogluconate dehydrogenase (decarboxylating)
MKRSELKQLIKEEIKKTFNENLNQEKTTEVNQYVRTPNGKIAIKTLKTLISKSYDWDDIIITLNNLYKKIGLDKKQFMQAATAAGLDFMSHGLVGGIEILDGNYTNPGYNIYFDEKDKEWGQ